MINDNDAMKHLIDLLSVEGPSGKESQVAETITRKLLAAGCRKAWIKQDNAHRQLGPGYSYNFV